MTRTPYTCTPDFTQYNNLLDNAGQPRSAYVERLRAMPDEALKEETGRKIWLSTHAANNLSSDYHWHVDACYDVLMDRHKSDAVYAECYQRVWEDNQ